VDCELGDRELVVLGFTNLALFEQFEKSVASSGHWIAGLDFPFGQSRTLVQNLGWPERWEDYVALIATISRLEFVDLLKRYRTLRSKGDKEHFRNTDVAARSKSPQKCCNPPVALMFFEGAPRLLRSNANILPLRPTDADAIIVEAYPALVARRWTNGLPYKSDIRRKQTVQQTEARRQIVAGLQSSEFRTVYGFELHLDQEAQHRVINDATGDQLDALLCALQAAWSYGHRTNGYGIPKNVDRLEGWIVDPSMLIAHNKEKVSASCFALCTP
jgi:hypothetical protein